jgi:hypothetical protein
MPKDECCNRVGKGMARQSQRLGSDEDFVRRAPSEFVEQREPDEGVTTRWGGVAQSQSNSDRAGSVEGDLGLSHRIPGDGLAYGTGVAQAIGRYDEDRCGPQGVGREEHCKPAEQGAGQRREQSGPDREPIPPGREWKRRMGEEHGAQSHRPDSHQTKDSGADS